MAESFENLVHFKQVLRVSDEGIKSNEFPLPPCIRKKTASRKKKNSGKKSRTAKS